MDTNVLLDVFIPDDQFGGQSRERLRVAHDAGAILVSDIVYAELAARFLDRSILDRALQAIRASVSPINTDIAYEAGLRWKQYRVSGGPRTRIITDFLIGAHAVLAAESFLTRDHRFFRTYFPELQHSIS